MITLFSAVAILFLTTLLALYVSRTALIEQRMSANELRHKQAFEAAQAGLDRAFIFLSATPQGVDKDIDGAVDASSTANGLLKTLDNGSQYRVAFCSPTPVPASGTNFCPDDPATAITCPTALGTTNFSTPLIISCGWSDDSVAHNLVRQNVGTNSPLVNTPQNPLTAKGAMNVGGSANVVNYYNNLTVWSGGALTSIGNAGKTFVRNPSVPPPDASTAPPDPPTSCSTSSSYVCLTDKNTTGPDVIPSDQTLTNIDNDKLFLNYFGRTLAQVKDDVAARNFLSTDNTALGNLAKAQGETIVITGDTTLPNVKGANAIGTRDRPVVLIIDGNLNLSGTPEVNGIVYVTGNVTGAGNVLVKGAMVVAGNVQPSGSVDIIFDPFATGNTVNSGKAGLTPGTWRDWR
ncbi:MAG TPA: PilX N-terminal domain-containing pilus assembly protein [Macromonas sp.]|nr:PilX N-terminal domain-containing pilus assembly protein [Macromonas sp.]